jgi:hypothetical protein
MGERSAAHFLRMLRQELMGYAALTHPTLAFIVFVYVSPSAAAETTVPFVGCPGFGMSSPPAPNGPPFKVNFPENIASKLALYVGENLAILAPRGWSCSGHDTAMTRSLDVYLGKNFSIDEPSETITNWLAEDTGAILTIGSFGGAYFKEIIPSHDIPGYVENAHEGDRSIKTAKQFLVPKFQRDRIKYMNNSLLVFSTPPKVEGLGDLDMYNFFPYKINSPSNYPITGVAKLINSPKPGYLLFVLNIKLDNRSQYLVQYIKATSISCLSKSLEDFCLSKATYPDQ